MKKHAKRKSMLGVTLLEILLVLAIAAMIIVMAVRYYQSTNQSQQVNGTLEQVQGIAAASDGLAQSTGKYSTVTSTALAPLLPSTGLSQAWGGAGITISSTASTVVIHFTNVPNGTCQLLSAKYTGNTHYTPSACTANAVTPTFSITYTP